MPDFHLEYLDREDYIASMQTLEDAKTLRFADMCLSWWDKQFGWYSQGCIALSDDKENHLCYIFFKIDRYSEYITVHNIFTPLELRRNGYAYALLKMVFNMAITKHVKRFKFSSVSKSLDFYLSLGFIYWGVNSVGDYYCDLPMPKQGLDGVEAMIENNDTLTLLGNNFKMIYKKVADNNTNLSDSQTIIYQNDLLKMGENYMFEELVKMSK